VAREEVAAAAAAATAAVGEGMCRYEEMGNEGEVESMPEVVNGVRSSVSGKCTRAVFLAAYVPKCTERLRCSASTGGG
jgi:phosphoenolpyruvate synthase/pyruvate phosphate dikinase